MFPPAGGNSKFPLQESLVFPSAGEVSDLVFPLAGERANAGPAEQGAGRRRRRSSPRLSCSHEALERYAGLLDGVYGLERHTGCEAPPCL